MDAFSSWPIQRKATPLGAFLGPVFVHPVCQGAAKALISSRFCRGLQCNSLAMEAPSHVHPENWQHFVQTYRAPTWSLLHVTWRTTFHFQQCFVQNMDSNSTFFVLFVSKLYWYVKHKQKEVQLPKQRLPAKYLTPCRTKIFKVMFCLLLAGLLDDYFSIQCWFFFIPPAKILLYLISLL